jgi:hypothetical protein
MAWSVLQGEPALMKLFKEAYGNGVKRWSAEKFQSRFQSSTWYRTHAESWRQARILELSDPKSYEARIRETQSSIEALATQRGITIDPKKLSTFAKTAFSQGRQSTESLLELMSSKDYQAAFTVSGNAGAAGADAAELERMAYDYGYKPTNPKFFQEAAYKMAMGDATIDTYRDMIVTQTASQYPAYKDQILSGAVTTRDIASTYIDAMSRTLEIDPDTIDLKDDKIQKALTGVLDETGKPVGQSVYDFTVKLKEDPRWEYTKNAKDSAETTGLGILRAFGYQG